MGPRARRVVNAADADREPHLVWNAFVDLIATTPPEELSDRQHVAHLAFLYDAEVQNGGHLQYFENHGTVLVEGTVVALDHLGARLQAAVLAGATAVWNSRPRERSLTAEQYVSVALEGEFDTFDSQYHACEPAITDLLSLYLEANREEFVELRDV
ncbi:MAG: DMP19 family protein [Terriglobia bacterium]